MADIIDDTLNVTLHDENKHPINVDLVSGKYKLNVIADATISGDESPTKYQLRWLIDPIGDSVSTTDVILHHHDGIGMLDFVACSSGSSTYEIAVKIDGVEQFRASMASLGSLGLTNAVNVPVWAENANKLFRLYPFGGMGFGTSFTIIGRATSGTQTITHAVLFREKT